MPAIKKKFNWKVVVIALATFLLGLSVLPAYSLGTNMYAEYQFGKTYQEDFRYRVAEEIEAEGLDLFTIGIHEGESYVVLWLYFDQAYFPDAETACEYYEYYLSRMVHIANVLYKYYPDKSVYLTYIAVDIEVTSTNGPVEIFMGVEVFNLDPDVVDFISEGLASEDVCSTSILGALLMYGKYANAGYYSLGYFGGEVLDRGPSYVYPWE